MFEEEGNFRYHGHLYYQRFYAYKTVHLCILYLELHEFTECITAHQNSFFLRRLIFFIFDKQYSKFNKII